MLNNKLFLSLLVCFQLASVSLQSYWVYREPVPVVVYKEKEPDLLAVGVAAAGVGLFAGILGWLDSKAQDQKKREYIERFKNLGYVDAQAEAYAKLAMDNPGGYQAVLDNIQRDNELRYNRESAKKLTQQKIAAERELTRLQHQQKLEQMNYKKQLEFKPHEIIIIILLILFLLMGIAFFSILFYQRIRSK